MKISVGSATRLAASVCSAAAVVAGVSVGVAGEVVDRQITEAPYALAAFTPLPTQPSTVLTFEGGIVGIQPWLHFTPLQLRGDLCDSPNTCKPTYYNAIPLGPWFNERGAERLEEAVKAQPESDDVTLFGHSQGGEVIYTALRKWDADPSSAPDPARVSWVSIGNPQNMYGGRGTMAGLTYQGMVTLPPDTPYKGIEVIRQYDGWADAPQDMTNILAVLNAIVGQSTYHVNYWAVDLNDPDNVTYTPNQPDGSPGNVTYMWIPSDTLPLIAWAGPLAPVLDKWLRPHIEKGYSRPVQLPDPHSPASASSAGAKLAAPVVPSAAAISEPAAAKTVFDMPPVPESEPEPVAVPEAEPEPVAESGVVRSGGVVQPSRGQASADSSFSEATETDALTEPAIETVELDSAATTPVIDSDDRSDVDAPPTTFHETDNVVRGPGAETAVRETESDTGDSMSGGTASDSPEAPRQERRARGSR